MRVRPAAHRAHGVLGPWLAAGAIMVLARTTLGAQPAPYRMEKLATGVYAAVRVATPGGASDSNVLIIINEQDVVVVDANIFPSSARQMIAEIKKLTPKPVRYVINTHQHSDHHFGNEAYRRAFPGVDFIQHPKAREDILTVGIPNLEKNVRTEYPAIIARYRKALETGKRSNGEPVTEELRKQLREALPVYEFFLQDVGSMQQIPGTLVIADSLILHRGDRRIVVKHLGLGNTAGDLVVHLPNERIVATGDLVVHPVPFAFESYLREWPATLRAVKSLDASIVVPGHGDIQRDVRYVDQLIALIESTWTQVERAVARGADLEATRKAVNVDAIVQTMTGADPTLRAAFAAVFITPGVEAAYKQLRPDLPRK